METSGKKSIDSSIIWGEPAVASSSSKTCIPDHYQSRDTVGTCLIVFALPLLIPGVTLTAVAFEDETGFTKYSALHVLGMVMLVGAGLFILVGVALLVRIGYKVVPEYNNDSTSSAVSTHVSNTLQSQAILGSSNDKMSNSSVIIMPPVTPTGSTDPTTVPGAINTSAPPSVPIPPSKIPLNFMIETGQGHNPNQPSTPSKASTVGSLPPINAMQADLSKRLSIYSGPSYPRHSLDGYVSSSFDEYSDDLDSDENSSGSYVITGENGAFQYSDEEGPHRQNSASENSDVSKPGPNKTSVTPRSGLTLNIPPSRNFFFEDNNISNAPALPDYTKMKRANKPNPGNLLNTGELIKEEETAIAQASFNPNQMVTEIPRDDSARQAPQEGPKKSPSTNMVPSPLGSPRHRLEAISNVSALASSMQMKNNELLPENIIGEMSESNGSVFTSGEEAEPVLEEDTKDTKRLSADDVICRKQYTPTPKRTFSFDVNTDDEKSTHISIIKDATGSVLGNRPRKTENISSSPKPSSILRAISAYDTPSSDPLQHSNYDERSSVSSGQHSSSIITSAIFSPTTTIFSFMNISSNDSSNSGGTGTGTGRGGRPSSSPVPLHHPQSVVGQGRHLLEPVPLKAKKHTTFNNEDVQVMYYD